MAGSGCRNEGLEEVHFYRESLFYDFVWKRFVSMEKKCVFMEKAHFCVGGLFL